MSKSAYEPGDVIATTTRLGMYSVNSGGKIIMIPEGDYFIILSRDVEGAYHTNRLAHQTGECFLISDWWLNGPDFRLME